MDQLEPESVGLKRLGVARRKVVSVSQENLVKAEPLQPGKLLPLLVQPSIDNFDLTSWAASARDYIAEQLLKHGGILFRGFNLKSPAALEQFIRTVSNGELLDYSYRSTPRTVVSGRIYTSTEYPASHSIPLHNEMAYSRSWPMKICFHCVQTAEQGGETPIADSRAVYARIDPKIKEVFTRKKVMYVRNYGSGIDLPWQTVFQTSDKAEVETYCRNAGIEFEWRDGDRLKTRQVCQSVAAHPVSGDVIWFNQVHLFHVSSLDPKARESIYSTFAEEDLPRNAYFGDGSPIDASILDEIRAIYQEEAIVFPWHNGDILLLDNMLSAHGRRPYSGARRVIVGMAQHYAPPTL